MCIVCAMFRSSVWQQIFNEFTRCVWSVMKRGKGEREGEIGKWREGSRESATLALFIYHGANSLCSALFSFHIQNTFGKYWYGRKLFKMRNTLDKLLTVKRCEALSGRGSRDWKYANHGKLLATCGVYLIIEQSALTTTKTQANCTSIIKLGGPVPFLLTPPQSLLDICLTRFVVGK